MKQVRMLGDLCDGRDNNLNLLRMIAAFTVLVGHAFPISLGIGAYEPLKSVIGIRLGTIAVMAFFVISGFLIARSFERTPTLTEWVIARILRIFPALIVVLLLTIFLLGPIVTEISLSQYFTDTSLITYFVKNVSLAKLQYDLPGVFTNNSMPTSINGSLWTLFHEVLCYFSLAVIGLLGILKRPKVFTVLFALYFLAYSYSLYLQADQELYLRIYSFHDMILPFAIGTLFYVWRFKLPIHFLGVIIFVVLAFASFFTPFFLPIFVCMLCYTTFVIAYLPSGWIRNYNKLGDYSYGFYIYAFPIQQAIEHSFAPLSPLQNIVYSTPITLVFAFLSWRLIEKPALASRHEATSFILKNQTK